MSVRYYGRYVDDFVLVHPDKAFLQTLVPKLRAYLQTTLHLTLHPKKIYLQHYSKGVPFLGTVIKSQRIYIAKRTKGNFYVAIQKHNQVVQTTKPGKTEREAFLSCMNSYLGILKHYKTYNLRKQMLAKNLSPWWWRSLYLSTGIRKFLFKTKVQLCQRGCLCPKCR